MLRPHEGRECGYTVIQILVFDLWVIRKKTSIIIYSFWEMLFFNGAWHPQRDLMWINRTHSTLTLDLALL